MKVTLDTNCIIALEKGEPEALFVRDLISLQDAHTINLRVVAISASERKQDGTYAVGFHEFTQKIAAVGLGQIEILPTLAYPGMAFPDWCYPTGGEPTSLERNIHEILFPTIDFENRDYRTRVLNDPTSDTGDPQWRNKKCDVLVLWSHIHFQGDIFVTSDKNFRSVSKKGQLIALGAGDIFTPQEAVLTIRAIRVFSRASLLNTLIAPASQNALLSLDMLYPALSVKVSESRTGQDVSILKLTPRLMSKGRVS